jgi:glycosyltransferase involved in cell wall biosynthesis
MVSLVPLKGTPVLDTSSPNKFFESLAAGVPVIQNTNGWMRDYLAEHNVGFTLDPASPEALADCLIELLSKPELLADMGRRASELAEKHFDKKILANQMLTSIEAIVDKETL